MPHSYVTENPKKEIQKVETFKQREKAELNLSVTKLKTKEIEGKLVNGKLVFDITDKKDIQEGNILVTQGTPYKPNNARVRSANPIQILEATKEANKLEVTGENLQDIYVNILDNKGQLVKIYKNIFDKILIQPRVEGSTTINLDITDEYDGGTINIINRFAFTNQGHMPKGITFHPINTIYEECFLFKVHLPTYIHLNGHLLNCDPGPSDSHGNHIFTILDNRVNISKDLIVDVSSAWLGSGSPLRIKLVKFPQKDFQLIFEKTGEVYESSLKAQPRWVEMRRYTIINFKYIIITLKGDSTLTFGEYYPVNEFVQFTANPTIQNAQPLALDNSVRDVTLETTGKGLVAMQQGDKLTVGGNQVVIGAGGNIGPQKLTIGNVKYTYEVKNGKFRIALNEWGILEPNRTIPIKIVRNENGKEKSLAEHNLTIKAPRKVAGTVNLKLNQDYNIRSFINFNGINLNAPGQASLEQPIAPGVSLTSVSGQGIPFMKEGDILQINDGLTRAVKSFTVGANGNLAKQKVRLNNGDVTIYVEAGKLRVGVDNWLVNKDIESQLRVLRGTNEIASHSFAIKAPEAPFNIKKNGLLDFGNVTSGTKRTAETDIVLEMLKDVSDVKFSLKDPQPILENLATGDTLKVNRIEYLVNKQDKRDYKVKLKGNLTIPEATKSGAYTGSTVLQIQIK